MGTECIFCKIATRELQTDLVYESPAALAFLDKHPAARGHTMVIPVSHAPTLAELDDDSVSELFIAVKSVMRRIDHALRPVGFNVGWNHGAAAGQHVFHLHVHILPRYREGGRGIQLLGEGTDRVDFAQLAAAIRGE